MLFPVLCYPNHFQFLVSLVAAIHISVEVIVVFLFNNLLFLAVKFLFRFNVFFFT